MKKCVALKNKKLYLFDIDGVIKLGDTLIDGALDLYNYINSIGGKSIFITNNSTKSIKDYVSFFSKLNFDVNEDNFITAASLTIDYLLSNHKNDYIYVVGTKSLVKEMKKYDLNVLTKYDEKVNVLLVGFDDELSYEKIVDACKLLQTKDLIYLATNLDYKCPVDFGFIPDCGAIVSLLENVTGKTPVFIVKPNTKMIDLAINNTGFNKEETVVVGDRLSTDILCGINANVDTCLVYSGEAKKEDIKKSKIKPTYTFDSVKELYDFIKE